MGAEGILHRYRGLLRDTIKNGGRQVCRQPACTALLHCPRDNPLDAPSPASSSAPASTPPWPAPARPRHDDGVVTAGGTESRSRMFLHVSFLSVSRRPAPGQHQRPARRPRDPPAGHRGRRAFVRRAFVRRAGSQRPDGSGDGRNADAGRPCTGGADRLPAWQRGAVTAGGTAAAVRSRDGEAAALRGEGRRAGRLGDDRAPDDLAVRGRRPRRADRPPQAAPQRPASRGGCPLAGHGPAGPGRAHRGQQAHPGPDPRRDHRPA
jgi:hypothetical protein